MNPAQLAQQLKKVLQEVRWKGGGGTVVFGKRAVRITAGAPDEEQMPPVFPWCLVVLDSGDPDETHPDLISQRFGVVACVDVAGDQMGEHAVVGGSAASLGKPAGRGIAEVGERVRSAVQSLSGADGASLLATATAVDAVSLLNRSRHLAFEQTTVTALCTSQPYYSPPQQIKHSSGIWTWEGAHCSERYDFLHYRLVEKSGSSPSNNVEDGTTVYTGTDATYTGAQTAGNVYTLFAGYTDRSRDTAEAYSELEVGCYKVAL